MSTWPPRSAPSRDCDDFGGVLVEPVHVFDEHQRRSVAHTCEQVILHRAADLFVQLAALGLYRLIAACGSMPSTGASNGTMVGAVE